jgi:hypothetical protein
LPIYVYRCGDDIREEFFPVGEAPDCIRHPVLFNRYYERVFTPSAIKVDKGEFFSHAFGKKFKNEKDQRDYAKHNGFIEVGNASVESVHKWEESNANDREKKLDADLNGVIAGLGL